MLDSFGVFLPRKGEERGIEISRSVEEKRGGMGERRVGENGMYEQENNSLSRNRRRMRFAVKKSLWKGKKHVPQICVCIYGKTKVPLTLPHLCDQCREIAHPKKEAHDQGVYAHERTFRDAQRDVLSKGGKTLRLRRP